MTTTEKFVTNVLLIFSVVALLSILFLAFGCMRFSLRPSQRNHEQRIADIHATLGVEGSRLNSMLLYDQATCDRFDNRAMGWTATTIVAGTLGGGTGLASIFTSTTPRIVVSSSSVFLATLSALSAYLGTSYSSRYAHGCTVNAGGTAQ